ncbi:hypothetical protein [Pseudomonas sp. AKS31]|uniref:hypothetical protein n=1 Tax=Pseudomonas sp. AKS31 TaxID=2949091 RepID=UPI00202A0E2D|nr:hypothetical protein [Pseudomonas sp. AKS31]MCL9801207.1 hypothetical protein [Pseudomonas sp. AKS31]
MSISAASFTFGARYKVINNAGVEIEGIVEKKDATSLLIGLGADPKQTVPYQNIASFEKVEISIQQRGGAATANAIKAAVADGRGKYK